jgi:hypothetical protein
MLEIIMNISVGIGAIVSVIVASGIMIAPLAFVAIRLEDWSQEDNKIKLFIARSVGYVVTIGLAAGFMILLNYLGGQILSGS